MIESMPADDGLPDALADEAAERFLAVPPPERADVLEELIGRYPAHERALRGHLRDLAGAERLLDASYPEPAPVPRAIGPYRVVARLGEGAFGTVFLCAQSEPIRRRVAVKVLRPGSGDRQTLARFEAERQVLARLAHPSITQVFDAGQLPDGRPFFVMEYVDGQPITDYCDSRGLDVGARLALFVDLCRGVEHAHNRGIVHRDLKPANLLVVDTESGPLPKIIDFGIAKALERGPDAAVHTAGGRVIGTPGYMSPEQAAGRPDEVDARSDVFALGVVLYELLTGALPWTTDAVPPTTDPPRPSARITTRGDAGSGATAPSQARRAASAVRGDLDWITLRALAREPDRRYPGPGALADDIERHRRGRTVSAGPPSLTYRVQKFLHRHRAAVRATQIASVVVAAALWIAWLETRTAESSVTTARAEADASFADAVRAVRALSARADDVRLREAPDGDAARRALLEDAIALYDRFVTVRPEDPTLREEHCRALLALSQVHWLLGEVSRAEAIAADARRAAEEFLAGRPDSVPRRGLLAEARRKVGRAMAVGGRIEAAHVEFAAAVAELEVCAAAEPENFGRSLSAALRELAFTLTGPERLDARLAATARSAAVLEELLRRTPDSEPTRNDLVFARVGLAERLLAAGRLDDAERALRAAEEDAPRLAGDAPRAETLVHSHLGQLAVLRGDPLGAARAYETAVAAAERWVATQPRQLLPGSLLCDALDRLARAQSELGDHDAAAAAYRRCVERAEQSAAAFPENPSRKTRLAAVLTDFAWELWARRRRDALAEAAACVDRALPIVSALPDGTPNAVERWQVLALRAAVLTAAGDPDAHASHEALASELPATSDRPGLLADAWLGVARARLDAGAGGAEAALRRAFDVIATGAAVDGGDPDLQSCEIDALELEARLRTGDVQAAVRAADRILAARRTWSAEHAAAACLRLAWQSAAAAGEAELAGALRERAATLDRSVVDALGATVTAAPDDPAHVVPWALALSRLAEVAHARGDTDEVVRLLDRALPALDRVRDRAHAHAWDESAVADARRLLAASTAPVRR